MSSILKALKKHEDDKTARRPEDLNIDAEILRSDNSPRFSSAGMLLAALLLLVGGSGVTYMYMKQGTAPGLAPPWESTAQSGEHKTLPATASDVLTEQLPASVVVVPAIQQKAAKKETSKIPRPAVPTRSMPVVAMPKQAQSILLSKPAVPAKIQKTHLLPLTSSVKEVPVLRVNGIAFQDGDAESVAIINGAHASSGSVIDGVKIEGIYKNKVIFSYNGENFEIQLGQSNR